MVAGVAQQREAGEDRYANVPAGPLSTHASRGCLLSLCESAQRHYLCPHVILAASTEDAGVIIIIPSSEAAAD